MIRKSKSSHHDDDNPVIDLPVNHYETAASFIMVLNRNVPNETKQWLVSLLKENQLDISIIDIVDNRYSRSSPSPKDLTLLISCSEVLFEQNVHHVYKQLKRQHLQDDSSLNTAEKQRILFDLIQRICSPNRTSIVGLPDITLYPGQSIFEICCHHKVITDYFPLHDYEHLQNLRSNYCQFFSHNIGNFKINNEILIITCVIIIIIIQIMFVIISVK